MADETTYTSNRKFKIAIATLGVASIVMIGLLAGHYSKMDEVTPVLWWWFSVSSTVLTLYGASNVIQKGITKGGE